MNRYPPRGRGHFEFGWCPRGRGNNKRATDGYYRGNPTKKFRGTNSNQHNSTRGIKRNHSTSTSRVKQRQGVKNVGLEYQYRVIAYVASLLLENSKVSNYVIYSNRDDIPGFDDIVVIVWFTEKETPCAYLGQIKHRYKKIDFKGERWKLSDYRDTVAQIINKKRDQIKRDERKEEHSEDQIEGLQDVLVDDIEFFLYSNNLVEDQPTLFNKHGIPLQCSTQIDETYKATFPIKVSGGCYKLIASGNVDDESSLFLNKTRLILKQSCNERILWDIMDIFKNEFSRDIAENFTMFVQKYFETETVTNITKEVIETELLRIRLSNCIIKPRTSVEMNADQAKMLNEITTGYDVVMFDHMKNIERNVCGFVLQKINTFFKCNLKWGELVVNKNGKLSKKFNMQEFENCIKSNGIKSSVNKPDTIDSLLKEMWRYDNMPLMLKIKDEMPILKKYKHLNKKFILICDVEKNYEEAKSFGFSTFASVADIEDGEKQTNLLSIIQISLQGREPVPLGDIIGKNPNCLKKLKSSEILHLIKKRRAYLEKRSFEKVEFMIVHKTTTKTVDEDCEVFPIEDSRSENVLINCYDIHDVDNCAKYKKFIKKHPEYEGYSFCYLQEREDSLEFIKENADKVKAFLVDEDRNPVYSSTSEMHVPIIGNPLGIREQAYISRYLHKPIINPKIFYEGSRIYFLCGDLATLDSETKSKIISDPLKLLQNKSKSINTDSILLDTTKSSAETWSQVLNNLCSWRSRPILYIEVIKGNLGLLHYRNCHDLSSFLSYDKDIVSENTFFEEVNLPDQNNNQITVISGEAGMGKSTLLYSLSKIYDKRYCVLFCDLAECRQYIKQLKQSECALDFVFSQYTSTQSYCKNFLRAVYEYHKSIGKIVLFIDSFDEILPVYKGEVMDFIKKVAKTEARVVIASRLIAKNLIIDEIDVRPLRIANLTFYNVEEFLKSRKINIHISKIPKELLVNPLYLKFIIFLSEKELLNLIDIDKLSLYDKVILEKVKRYHDRIGLDYDHKIEPLADDILEIHQIVAMVVIFGKEWLIEQNVIKNGKYKKLVKRLNAQKIKLGLVKEYRNDYPVFIHQTVAEFLAAQWLSENLFDEENANNIFEKLLHKYDTDIRYFFDRLVCKSLELHQAVLKGNLTLVQDMCGNHNTNIEEVDKCGRNCLHLASEYCSGEQRYKIIEVLVNHLLRRKYDFNTVDKYMKFNWFDYLKLNNIKYFEAICCFGLTTLLIICLKYDPKIIKSSDIDKARSNHKFHTLLFLFRMCPYLPQPHHFSKAVTSATEYGCLGTVCELIHLYCKSDPRLNVFFKVCQNLLKISDMKNIEYVIDFKVTKYNFTSLHIACLYGHVPLVQQLLQLGADVSITDNFKRTALHYAVIQGTVEIIRLLLESADTTTVNLKDQNECSCLHLAVKFSKLNLIQLLLESGVFINEKDKVHETVLHIAARRGSVEICEFLLENGADHGYENKNVSSAFLVAAEAGNLDVLHLLLNYGANIFHTNSKFNSALHLACAQGHDKIIEYLLKKSYTMSTFRNGFGSTPMQLATKERRSAITEIFSRTEEALNTKEEIELFTKPLEAEEGYTVLHLIKSAENAKFQLSNPEFTNKINAKTSNGETPLHVACRNGYEDVVEVLLLNNANISVQDISGQTPIHIAVQNGNVEITKMLLKYGADVNNMDNLMETPLYFAVKNPNIELVRLLVESGAYINHQNYDGRSALHVAAKLEETDIAETLLQNHADVNQTDYCETTALHISVDYQNIRTVELFLKHGADVNHADNCGNAVLHIAVEHQNIDIVEVLLRNNAVTPYLNNKKHSPVDIAVRKKSALIQRKLIQNCRATNNYPNCKSSCLKIAVFDGDVEIAKRMLDGGADVSDFNNMNLLHIAAEQETTDMIKLLLEVGANINGKGYDSETALFINDHVTALHVAAIYENLEAVRTLLENGANIIRAGYNSYSPLHIALNLQNLTISELILEWNVDIQSDMTALKIATDKRRVDILDMLLKYGLDVKSLSQDNVDIYLNSVDRDKDIDFIKLLLEQCIHVNVINKSVPDVAIKEENLRIAKWFLETGTDINLIKFSMQSALHVAVELEDMHFVDLLINANININYVCVDNGSALHVAVEVGNMNFVNVLLDKGINVNLVSKQKGSALHLAIEKENMDIINFLLKSGIDINLGDCVRGSALHIATEVENMQIVKLLLEEGADTNIPDERYNRPLDIALDKKNADIIELLVKSSVSINRSYIFEQALLHFAVRAKKLSLVKLLLEKGVDSDLIDECNETPLHIAIEEGDINLVKC